MQNPFFFGVGGVLSADIAVPDHQRELEFFSKILTTGDTPLWREDLMNNLGTPIIGLGARTPEYDMLPLQWMPHFQVADIADSVAGANEMGGKELMHSQTDDGQSQWAVLTDPDGAAFGLIPVVPAESNPHPQDERVGCIAGLSLFVSDAESSRDFYQRVIGWDVKSSGADDGSQFKNYQMQAGETTAAEIGQGRVELQGIPPVWLIHIPVDDLDESLRRVTDNGGKVIKEFDHAKYAVVSDPVGVFLVLQSG